MGSRTEMGLILVCGNITKNSNAFSEYLILFGPVIMRASVLSSGEAKRIVFSRFKSLNAEWKS